MRTLTLDCQIAFVERELSLFRAWRDDGKLSEKTLQVKLRIEHLQCILASLRAYAPPPGTPARSVPAVIYFPNIKARDEFVLWLKEQGK